MFKNFEKSVDDSDEDNKLKLISVDGDAEKS